MRDHCSSAIDASPAFELAIEAGPAQIASMTDVRTAPSAPSAAYPYGFAFTWPRSGYEETRGSP